MIFWSGSALKFIPFGDRMITVNGVTYTPLTTPLFDLDYDDFILDGSTAADGEARSPECQETLRLAEHRTRPGVAGCASKENAEKTHCATKSPRNSATACMVSDVHGYFSVTQHYARRFFKHYMRVLSGAKALSDLLSA